MAENQIKKVSVRHDAIMDFLLCNPTVPLGTVAAEFGVSQAWLSVILHSDAFQSQLKGKQVELFGATVVPIREQLTGIAALGLAKLGQVLEHTSPINDKAFIADTTDMVLKNLGYSPKGNAALAGNVEQQNVYVITKDELASARDLMRTSSRPTGGVLIEQTVIGDSTEGV